MFETFPEQIERIADWTWKQFAPYADYLRRYDLTEQTIQHWLTYETRFFALINEWHTRLSIRLDGNTLHQATQQQLDRFNREIQPNLDQLQQDLTEKLLASDLRLSNYDVPLRHLRADAGAFLHDNAEIQREMQQLRITYQQILSSQTVLWDGKEQHLTRLIAAMNTPNRDEREKIYRVIEKRRAEDKLHFDSIWSQLMLLRDDMMQRTSVTNFRDLRWRQLKRFDYTPRDVMAFCGAIERVVVPLMQTRHEQHRQRLGIETLRPYDLFYDPAAQQLTPYQSLTQLLNQAEQVFSQIEPQFASYFQTMRREKLLDLENRPNKSPLAYSTILPHSKRPFIFWNMIGGHADVEMLIHEAGHAFHAFESAKWPYLQQRRTTDEMNELAAMTLEMLALDHYDIFYSDSKALAYARTQRLETALQYWIDAAMSASFQHWVYSHHEAATDAACCDAKWRELLLRYYPGLDFRGLEQQMNILWWHNTRIFFMPFYAIEYAIAQLGAVQIWQQARKNRARTIQRYRAAMALGNTKSLRQLYQTAGISLSFDEATLQQAVDAIEMELMALEAV